MEAKNPQRTPPAGLFSQLKAKGRDEGMGLQEPRCPRSGLEAQVRVSWAQAGPVSSQVPWKGRSYRTSVESRGKRFQRMTGGDMKAKSCSKAHP